MIHQCLFGFLGLGLVIALSSCSYGHIATIGKEHVVITKNDSFLAGLLRKVYVCKATPAGLKNCEAEESP